MTPVEVAVALAALLVGALTKSITGMGFPLVAIPVISLFVSVEDAVVVIALPNVVMNLVLFLGVRSAWSETRDLPVLGISGIAGAVAGTFALVRVPEGLLVLVLAVVVLGYVSASLVNPQRSVAPATARRWAAPVGAVAGVMQGAVGISGPIVSSWIHAYRLPRDAFVSSVTLMFLLSGSTQLVVLAAEGAITGTRLVLTLTAVPIVLATIPVGTRLRHRLPEGGFDRVVLAVLALSAVALVVRVLA